MRTAGVLLALLALMASFAPASPADASQTSSANAVGCVSTPSQPGGSPAGVPAVSDGFHAVWWGQSSYPTLCPGGQTTLTVSYYNSGTLAWTGLPGASVSLGTYKPVPGQDKPSVLGGDGTNGTPATGWARYNRPATQTGSIASRQVLTLSFTIRAPMTPGVYALGVRPLIEGVQWLEDYGVYWRVIVLNPDGSPLCKGSVLPASNAPATTPLNVPGFHAAWFGQSGFPTMCPGDKQTLSVTYRNTGTMPWTSQPGATAFLGTWGPDPGQDRPSALASGWTTANRPAVQTPAVVAPGASATFTFTIVAPPSAGVYWLMARPLIEGVTWLEDQGLYWKVTVLDLDGSAPKLACDGCWPLAGRTVPDGANVYRRAINVRIDNAPDARPHSGISQADMVWEMLVEGRITRLAAIFHSQDPDQVGSVRSARLSDRYITPMIRGGLSYSGATIEETAAIQQDAAAGLYRDLNAGYTDGYYRVPWLLAPHNEYVHPGVLRSFMAAHGGDGPVAIPSWAFLADPAHSVVTGGMLGSGAGTDVVIGYRDFARVEYVYDQPSNTYARYQAGVRDADALNGAAVAASNVVIIYTDIWETSINEDIFQSKGLDMRLTGTGRVTILRDGRRQEGSWSRATNNDAFTFTSQYGDPILLDPGQTWIHVIPSDGSVPVSQ